MVPSENLHGAYVLHLVGCPYVCLDTLLMPWFHPTQAYHPVWHLISPQLFMIRVGISMDERSCEDAAWNILQ